MNGGESVDNYDWIQIPAIEKLEGLTSSQRINYLNATILILKAVGKDVDELTAYKNKVEDAVASKEGSVFTLNQQENIVSKEDIVAMIKKIKKELTIKNADFRNGTSTNADNNLYQLYVILKIYELLPIRNEIANVLIIKSKDYENLNAEDKDNNNYLVINKSKFAFYFSSYKTSNTYGLRIVEIPNVLKLIIQKWIKIKGNDIPNLFIQKRGIGGALTTNNLTKILSRASMKYMGKSVSTLLLRKIFYSAKYASMKEELVHGAQVSGHSPTMAMSSYIN